MIGWLIWARWWKAVGHAGAACRPFAHLVDVTQDHVEDAHGLLLENAFEPLQLLVIGVVTAERREQQQGRERHRGQDRLAGALPEPEGFLLLGGRSRPASVGHVTEGQPGQRVENRHDGAGAASRGEQPLVIVSGGKGVAEVQRGDAEVGQQLEVVEVEVTAGGERPSEHGRGGVPVARHHLAQAEGQLGVATLPLRRVRGDGGEGGRVDVDAGVATEGRDRGRDHRHLAGPIRVVAYDVARSLEEHPVGDLHRAGVPLDPCSQPDDVGQQQRVLGGRARRVDERASAHRPPGEPGAPRRAEQALRATGGVRTELRGALPGRCRGLVTASCLGAAGGAPRGRRPRRHQAGPRTTPGARRAGPHHRDDAGHRPGRRARGGGRCSWRRRTARTGRAGASARPCPR